VGSTDDVEDRCYHLGHRDWGMGVVAVQQKVEELLVVGPELELGLEPVPRPPRRSV